MEKGKYILNQAPEQIEEQRLALLESMVDPETTRRMEEFGVGPGWNCLEVGAGHGSIARWLAERVGSRGHIVATDIDLRFLKRIRRSNLEIRCHDVCETDFEPSAYHLVHCRALLQHVPKPEEILARMAKAVRPGGWLFVEETDYGSFGSVDPAYPGAVEFDRSNRVIFDLAQAAGVMWSYIGRRIPGLVERLGFENFGYVGMVTLGRGGDHPSARFARLSARASGTGEQLIAAGVQTREQLDHVQHMFEDPSFEFVGPIMFRAWARRP